MNDLNNNDKIVILQIRDTEDSEILDVFYLKNPNQRKLNYLKLLLKHRFDDDNIDDNGCLIAMEQYEEVVNYVKDNFEIYYGINTFSVEW